MGIIDFFYDLYDGERERQHDEEFYSSMTTIIAGGTALIGLMLRYVTPDEGTRASHIWQTAGAWVGWPALVVAFISGILVYIAEKGKSDRERAKKHGEAWHKENTAWQNELELEKLRKENTQLKENQCPPTNDPRTQQAPGARRY